MGSCCVTEGVKGDFLLVEQETKDLSQEKDATILSLNYKICILKEKKSVSVECPILAKLNSYSKAKQHSL